MTGQVLLYYIDKNICKTYQHLTYSSDSCALSGECLVNHHNKGIYYFTNNKNEVKYYKEQSNLLLKKATSLMDIYTKDNIENLEAFFKEDIQNKGTRKRVLSSLPIHSLSDKLLEEIINNNKLTKQQKENIKLCVKHEKEYFNILIKNNKIIEEISFFTEEEFKKYNISLNLSTYIGNINYSYQTYLKHYEETKKYKHKNYSLIEKKEITFTNIDIYINSKQYVLISKKNNPNIHFLIKHDKLINAIENFIPLITN